MTIKELYETAKINEAEDFEICFPLKIGRDNAYFCVEKIDIDSKERTVFLS